MNKENCALKLVDEIIADKYFTLYSWSDFNCEEHHCPAKVSVTFVVTHVMPF